MRRTLSSSVSSADFVGREPGDVVRFVAEADLLAGVGDEQEAHVVVLVGVFDELAGCVVAGRDLVHVDVERHQHAVDRHEIERGHARFFAGFAEGDFFDVPLAVGVAAELQPAVELAVMREQAAAAVGREDPGGARDVAGPAGAVEAIGVALRPARRCGRRRRLRPGKPRDSGPACRAAAGGAWGEVSVCRVSVVSTLSAVTTDRQLTTDN